LERLHIVIDHWLIGVHRHRELLAIRSSVIPLGWRMLLGGIRRQMGIGVERNAGLDASAIKSAAASAM
jgi:hypothetical protein